MGSSEPMRQCAPELRCMRRSSTANGNAVPWGGKVRDVVFSPHPHTMHVVSAHRSQGTGAWLSTDRLNPPGSKTTLTLFEPVGALLSIIAPPTGAVYALKPIYGHRLPWLEYRVYNKRWVPMRREVIFCPHSHRKDSRTSTVYQRELKTGSR